MNEHFFSRWSRRKQAAGQGLLVDEPAQSLVSTGDGAADAVTAVDDALSPVPLAFGEACAPAAQAPEPLPTLQDAQALTPTSDFQSFMRQGVPAEVRNAAVKKLFTDPHFNLMDGLDIYIGDYNTPDPLPASMLQKMVSAQFMNLVPPDGDQSAQVGPETGLQENPDAKSEAAESGALVAQSPHSQALAPATQQPSSEHDNPDLQLQPNHAPASPEAGQSTG